MSRQIDWEQPLSEKDREWAMQFPLLHPLVLKNDEEFAGDAETLGGVDEDEVPPYSDTKYWTKETLAVEATKRDLAVPAKVKREDLVALLEADDIAHRGDTE